MSATRAIFMAKYLKKKNKKIFIMMNVFKFGAS